MKVNFLWLAVLLMSGLQIFNAHSPLYWGQAWDFQQSPGQQGSLRGVTTILGHDFDTTGVFGVSYAAGGRRAETRLSCLGGAPCKSALDTGPMEPCELLSLLPRNIH